jgi:hypothetical protein
VLKFGDVVIPMNTVEYLVGHADIDNTPLRVFDDGVCAFLNEFSTTMMRSSAIRLYPEVAALAFWCRKANITKLKALYPEYPNRLGRGVCFHVSPSNIPVNFAFSFFFSLLAGNANIVRLPSKPFGQIDVVCAHINDLLRKYPEIAKRTAFVRYPVNNEITSVFSAAADARMIWGGDETVASIKALATKPRTVDVCFPDRYSLCLIDANEIMLADDDTMRRLAEGFYNDTFMMDQNACSSPQIILWVNDAPQARVKFWQAVMDKAVDYDLQDAVAVDKYTKLCGEAITLGNIQHVQRHDNLIYRIELSTLNAQTMHLRGKGGYFYEAALSSYASLYAMVTERFQTLTYFGIDAEVLRANMIAHHVRGVDRIVPIGKAMDIGVMWDGYDLIRQLSRVVHLA